MTYCHDKFVVCILTEGGTDKKHPGQNLSDKRQNPRIKPPRTIERGILSGCFVLGLLKMGEFEMCDVLWGVPGCVTKCDRGREGQNWPKIA